MDPKSPPRAARGHGQPGSRTGPGRPGWRKAAAGQDPPDPGSERGAGELLGKLEKKAEGRPEKLASVGELSEFNQVLKDTDTSHQDASRWQTIAGIRGLDKAAGGFRILSMARVSSFPHLMPNDQRENLLKAAFRQIVDQDGIPFLMRGNTRQIDWAALQKLIDERAGLAAGS